MTFWLFIILAFISLVVGLLFLSYWIPKKFGKRKLGLWLSGILTLGILLFAITIVFEDKFFFKSDAQDRLREHNIELKDDFKIISNKSGGILDYSHQFTLKISAEDKESLINQIKSAANYQDEVDEMFDFRIDKPRHSDIDTVFTANYNDKWNYTYQYYKPNQQGNKPIWDIISISKKDTTLTYLRVLD